jgi:N-acetylmuramoyl-L-alanine amidase
MRERKGIRLLALILALVMLPVIPVAAEEDVVIVLDPGHGGIDSGTVMEYDGEGIWESTLNLEIAGYCRDYLEENYENVQVYLTRETDKKVTLDERVDFAEAMGADYMLSIHINSIDIKGNKDITIFTLDSV